MPTGMCLLYTQNSPADGKEEQRGDGRGCSTDIWKMDAVVSGTPRTETQEMTFNLVKEDGEWKMDFTDELKSGVDEFMRGAWGNYYGN